MISFLLLHKCLILLLIPIFLVFSSPIGHANYSNRANENITLSSVRFPGYKDVTGQHQIFHIIEHLKPTDGRSIKQNEASDGTSKEVVKGQEKDENKASVGSIIRWKRYQGQGNETKPGSTEAPTGAPSDTPSEDPSITTPTLPTGETSAVTSDPDETESPGATDGVGVSRSFK